MRDNEKGFIVSPWVVTLVVSIVLNVMGFAYTWGTVVTRLDALAARIERMERVDDARREITRSPAGYSSPPIGRER